MNRRWLQRLPSLCFSLLLLAGCQAGQDSPSDPLGRGLEGSARCGDPDLNREKRLFPDGERQRQVEDLCQDILAGRIDADLGADQLHVLAFQAWQNDKQDDNLGNATAQDLAEFNAAVRGLDPVALLDGDEQPVWNTTNIGDEQFLAVGPTTANGIHCFGSGLDTWCFQVNAGGASYFFLAEAKADQADLGVCAGPLANDCEKDVIHIDVNPDEAVDDEDENTNVNVWSCTDFATRHARFGVGPPGEDPFGDPGPAAPQQILDGCGVAFELEGIQRWVWAGLKPLRWAAGVGTLNAGGTGTTFSRGSDVSEGEEGSIRVRDIVCKVSAKFASISDGAECKLLLGGTTQAVCTTISDGQRTKTSSCTWEDIPVPADVSYHAVVDKQNQTGTPHHAEGDVNVAPGNPARDEIMTCTFDLAKSEFKGCVSGPI
jgi:hypothetical protein